MKKILILLLVTFTFSAGYSQYVYTIKADSVKLTNDSCSTELIIENSTRNVCGFLFNKGNGRTEFRKVLVPLGGNKYLVGCDTLDLSGIVNADSVRIRYAKDGLVKVGDSVYLGNTSSGSGSHNFTTDRYQYLNGNFYSIGGTVNDPVTKPVFRFYNNGDFTAKAQNNLTGNFGSTNGLRYTAKYGILEVGTSNNFDTTLSNTCCGNELKSSIIINSDDGSNNIKGHLHGSLISGYNSLVDTTGSVIISGLFGGSHIIKAPVKSSLVAGGFQQINATVGNSFMAGLQQVINKPLLYGFLNGAFNTVADTSNFSVTSGIYDSVGGVSQLTVGSGLVNRSPFGVTLGNQNVSFTTLPFTGERGRHFMYAIPNLGNYPLFVIANSIGNEAVNSIKSNALTTLFNGRTQINTTGFTNNLTQSDVTPKAAFEVVSTNSGVLLPRLATSQRDAIISGDLYNGLLLYNTDVNKFQYYKNNFWTTIGDSASASGLIIAKDGLIKNGDSLSLGSTSSGSSTHNFTANRYQYLNGNFYSIGGTVNDPVTQPVFRFYNNGDFTAKATNSLTGNDANSNGIRYTSKYGIFEVGTANNFDTTIATTCCGNSLKSSIIVNSDFQNVIRGHVHGSVISGLAITIDTTGAVVWSNVVGGGHVIKASLGYTYLAGYGHQINAKTYQSVVSGANNYINYPFQDGYISGVLNTVADTSWFSSVNGIYNRFGGVGQVVFGNNITNRTPYGIMMGNKNVDFSTLPYTGQAARNSMQTISNLANYPLFVIANSNGNEASTAIKSNALTTLFNGRTQINTTGFTNNLSQSDVTPKAAFEVVSTNSGVLLPKLTTSQRDAIVSGDLYNGLLLYNTDVNKFQYYKGSVWTSLGDSTSTGSTPTLQQVTDVGNTATNDLVINDLTIGKGASFLYGNTAMGRSVLENITTGNKNTALGDSALNANVTGNNITALGYKALVVNTGSFNTAVGFSSMLSNTSGIQNTAIGLGALLSNTTGSNNTGVGSNAGNILTTGSKNVFVGFSAGLGITTGSGNVVIGTIGSLPADLNDNIIFADGDANKKLQIDSIGAITLTKYTTNNFNGGSATDSVMVISSTGVIRKRNASDFGGVGGGSIMAANTIKGNNTNATALPIDLTGTQVTAMLNNFTTTTKGLVPAGSSDTTKFLRADGVFANPNYKTLVTLASDVTNNNATANTIANVTGLSFEMVAGTIYRFHALIVYTASAITNGSRWAINGTASPTLLSYNTRWTSNATAEINNFVSGYDLPAASGGSSLLTGNVAIIDGIIKPSASGTFTIRFASKNSGASIVAKAGSTLEYW